MPATATDLDVFACPLDGLRLVEASAGTGKTWNICGLYLRLLLEQAVPVESLLVVTFTRAATAEQLQQLPPLRPQGYRDLRRFAARWPGAEWAIEGACGLGAPLTTRLFADEIGAAQGFRPILACDNTLLGPVFQRPLDHGADVSVYSLTKYVGGHSDLMAGAVVLPGNSPLERPIRMIQHHKGSVAAPFDCWLALRGLQSLPVRMRAHCSGALDVATALAAHPAVETVLFPGLASDPGHALATRQMHGFGAMLSFVVRGGAEAAMKVAAGLKLVTRATSLGGTHSLIEHRASVESPKSMAPAGLLRVSVGLEHPQDIIADFNEALSVIAG